MFYSVITVPETAPHCVWIHNKHLYSFNLTDRWRPSHGSHQLPAERTYRDEHERSFLSSHLSYIWPQMHLFGLWQEAAGNPCWQREDVQTHPGKKPTFLCGDSVSTALACFPHSSSSARSQNKEEDTGCSRITQVPMRQAALALYQSEGDATQRLRIKPGDCCD